MGFLHLRRISSEESRYLAFHCVIEMKNIDLEDSSLWPKNVVIGRYRLNDSSWEWLKTLPKSSQSKVKQKFLKCSVYNARSVRNKTMKINCAILSSQSQLITITESWIQTNENDDFLIKKCLPENYIPLTFPGSSRLMLVFFSYIEKIFLFLFIKIYATETSKLLLVEYFP